MIRNFMRAFFPKLIDVFFMLSLLSVLIGAVAAAQNPYGGGIVLFLAVAVAGAVLVTLAFGGIYVLLDIRDGIRDLANKQ